MFFISFLLLNVIIAIIFKIYCKLSCGICKCSKHLVGKVVIVTGGNAGIGFETAKDLADRGARVILACRNEERGTRARDSIIAATGNQDIHYRKLDLASFASVREFANDIIKTETRLDILINNAGIYQSNITKTEDGLFLGIQTNHFGPFLLTNMLLPLLKTSAPSRIINVSSTAHKRGVIDFQNLNMEKETKETYSGLQAYKNSKLCNVLMTVELSRLLKGTGVTANSLHPGVIYTDIMDSYDKAGLKFVLRLFSIFFKTTWEGAQTSIYLAVAPEVSEDSGYYFSDCQKSRPAKVAEDTNVSRKLWEVSEKLVKLK